MKDTPVKKLLKAYLSEARQDIYDFETVLRPRLNEDTVKDDQYIIASNYVVMINNAYLKAMEVYHLYFSDLENEEVENTFNEIHSFQQRAKKLLNEKDNFTQSGVGEIIEDIDQAFDNIEF